MGFLCSLQQAFITNTLYFGIISQYQQLWIILNEMTQEKSRLFTFCLISLASFHNCTPSSFEVFRFGSPDKLGSVDVGPEGSKDYLEWDKDALPVGEFPTQFSLCFNMRYLTMDYWSAEQKTILRIFPEDVEEFWIRVNHSPPRGTLIINSGTLWSGGLGSFREVFSDNFDIQYVKSIATYIQHSTRFP